MSEWKKTTLGEIADIEMGQSPKGETCNTIGNGIPLLNGPTEFKIKNPKAVQYTIDSKRECRPLDLLFCVRGSTGRMNWADKRYSIGRGLAAIRHKSGSEYRCFLRGIIDYNLKVLLSSATGSIFSNITKKQLENLEIKLPPLSEQKSIASVLSSLDDKIDLLHRQNATLEKMAETLFRQWFVEEADDEWEEKPLSYIANFLNGLACQKFLPKNDIEKLPVLKIKELREGITENSDWVTTDVEPEYIVKNGDVIFAWSASLMVKIWDGQDCILNQHLFKVTSDDYPKWFYYLWCKHHLEEFIAIAASHATTMGHIKRRDLDEAMVLIPSIDELEKMTLIVEPLIDKIIENNKQIRTLTALRDTLLPKLMSGEMRVEM